MSDLQKCLTLTEEIIVLARTTSDDQRDITIEKIEGLLQQRSTFFAQLQAPYSDEEKEIGKKLLARDQEMNTLLNQYLKIIQKDIETLDRKKKSVNLYSNPYAAANSLDGMFYDKRQ
ncbi:hypothetical protein [Lederbergia galactosidilytica]|uniref:Flagellar protein FliT n=1 Tax=Lederbergia galactosidilytica TaxID=217031 RepID=A0A177ZKI6_9BACI|nr:hypothetical protein [Lederbergia galactosidilytica]OAK67959.1 hypothetical protein ABB05_18170 [Lederbergia galactosidilytica]